MLRWSFKRCKHAVVLLSIIVFYSTAGAPLTAQKENLKNLITSFNEYNTLQREVAYCHLNKSTYIKGEMLGFSGYVFDKESKTPSTTTKNLYCVITDSDNAVVKSKLVQVVNGFTNNIFKIDSVFTAGNYTFKAYTNWMNNFDEPNAFIESFRVLDPDVDDAIKKTISKNNLDVQLLPEGGNFIDFVETTVGVIIKDSKGFGVANVEGHVYDTTNTRITSFKTNAVGIGRFLLYPDKDQSYVVRMNHLNKDFEYTIENIESKGISVTVSNARKKLAIAFKTNDRTLKEIKGKQFNMTIHNGKEVKGVGVIFSEKDYVKMVDQEELFSGMNIITLLDENNRPVLERLYFNYEGVELLNSGTANYTRSKDSIRINFAYADFDTSMAEYSNISISVLPEKTNAYQRHHTVISQVYLQPYVQGYVENAHYYFTNVDAKKKYDLDNLLLTQGWSSYNWEHIFSSKFTDNFVFEDGILIKANQNNKRQQNFLIYPLSANDGLVVNLTEDQQSFVLSNLYPADDEKLGIATLNKKGKVRMPNLNMEFFPSEIPEFKHQFNALHPGQSAVTRTISSSQFTLFDSKGAELLDEVNIEADAKLTKIKNLRGNAFQIVDVFDDNKRAMNLNFTNYINYYVPGYIAYETSGNLEIRKRVSTSLYDSIQRPIVYLDGVFMPNLQFFYGFDMSAVDYITVNRSGAGEGFLGANGVIRIYTSLDYIKKSKNNSFKQFEFPLTFSKRKKFYVPKYEVYNDDFFNQYGVIDWIPKCDIDANGNLNFTVYNPTDTNMKLFIEGVTGAGEFIAETKLLKVNDTNQ